jgi:hypothetical protein
MPFLIIPAFWYGDEEEEQDVSELVVLVSPYETGRRAVLVPRRGGDD